MGKFVGESFFVHELSRGLSMAVFSPVRACSIVHICTGHVPIFTGDFTLKNGHSNTDTEGELGKVAYNNDLGLTVLPQEVTMLPPEVTLKDVIL